MAGATVVAAMLAALVLVAEVFVAIPTWLLVACLIVNLLAVCLAVTWAWRAARASGDGRLRSAGRALRAGSRALWELLMP